MNYKVKIFLPIVGLFLLIACAALAVAEETEGGSLFFRAAAALKPARTAVASPAPVKEFNGSRFETSGVQHVPGTDGVLFVDDGRPEEIFWMRVGADGSQLGAVKTLGLGASVVDMEGMTHDGTHFYVVGSLSKATGADLAGLARFRFDARAERVEGTEAVMGLKRFLAANVAELRGMEEQKYKDGGINIEGVAWDPRGQRLLIGLRSPIVDGQALVVPLRLRDPRGPFSAENLEVEGARAIRLPLGGAGIRSIEYDERTTGFHLVSGAGPNAEKLDFKFWEWDGREANPGLRETFAYDRKLKPEGLTRVNSAGRDFTFIVFDTSGYAATN